MFHIRNVMRYKVGDEFYVSDQIKSYLVKITEILDKEVAFEIVEEIIGNHELPVFVSIFQGYPKGDKIEEIIKHGKELGAYEFVSTIMKR